MTADSRIGVLFPLDAVIDDISDSVEIKRARWLVVKGIDNLLSVSFFSDGDRRDDIVGGAK